jgi:hypothetical protein
MPASAWVLGVDEHTAGIFDFSAGTFTVLGLGGVTVRRQGESVSLPSGQTMAIDELLALAARLSGTRAAGTGTSAAALEAAAPGDAGPGDGSPGDAAPLAGAPAGGAPPANAGPPPVPVGRQSPLMTQANGISAAFDDALVHRDAQAATQAVLELEAALHGWSADTFESDELDRARASLRRNLLRLGEAAGPGLRDPRKMATPWVEALLVERDEARSSRRFADADRIRQSLAAAGVEVRDTPAGTEWDLRPEPAP